MHLKLVFKPARCGLERTKLSIPASDIIRWSLILAGRKVIKIGCVSGTSYLKWYLQYHVKCKRERERERIHAD